VLVDPVLGRKRVAVLAYRRGADVTALDAERVAVDGYLWRPDPPRGKGKKAEKAPMPPVETLQDALRRQGPFLRDAAPKRRHDHKDAISIDLLTPEPGRVLSAVEAVADELGLSLWPTLSDPEPVRSMLTRLRADLDQGPKEPE